MLMGMVYVPWWYQCKQGSELHMVKKEEGREEQRLTKPARDLQIYIAVRPFGSWAIRLPASINPFPHTSTHPLVFRKCFHLASNYVICNHAAAMQALAVNAMKSLPSANAQDWQYNADSIVLIECCSTTPSVWTLLPVYIVCMGVFPLCTHRLHLCSSFKRSRRREWKFVR